MSSTEEEVEEAKAATKIQAVFRGRQVRKQGQGSGADETAVSTNDQEGTSSTYLTINTNANANIPTEVNKPKDTEPPRYTLAEIENILKNKPVNVDPASPRDKPIMLFLQNITKREEETKGQQKEIMAQNEALRKKLADLENLVQNQSTKIKELKNTLNILQRNPAPSAREEDVHAFVKAIKYRPETQSPPKLRNKHSLPRPETSPTDKMLERLEQIRATYTTLVKIPETNSKKKPHSPLASLEKGFVL